MELSFTVNGSKMTLDTNPMRRLLDVLRDDLGFYEVHEGCGEGECGSCGILVEGRIVNSCITPVIAVQDCTVQTTAGIRDQALYTRIENAFAEAGAVQCGYCTSGFVLSAYAFLQDRAASPASDAGPVSDARNTSNAAGGASGGAGRGAAGPGSGVGAGGAGGPAGRGAADAVNAPAGESAPPPLDEEEIRRALAGNLCRCTGYNMIVDAVRRAAAGGEA